MACAICRNRRPRRFCPGVHGDICTVCCGTEREITVECPLDCEYLQQAHEFEKPSPEAPELPHPEIEISPEFLEEHEEVLTMLSAAIVMAAEQTPGAVDLDVRDALAGLTQTYITLDKGVVYEHLPPNPLAAGVFRLVQKGIAEFMQDEADRGGHIRDSELLRLLVFFERVAVDRDNGRKRGRAFLSMIYRLHGSATEPEAPSSTLILP